MPGFMITLLICSITMSALALLYMALTPFLAKRYSEKVRYFYCNRFDNSFSAAA